MKLLKAFFCAPAGEIYPREIAAGEECPRELEQAAAALGLLAPASPLQKKPSDKAADKAGDKSREAPAEKSA